jgi:hypothetical protein
MWLVHAGRRGAAAAAAVAALIVAGAPLLPAQPAAAYGSGCSTPVVRPVGPFAIASDHRTVTDHTARAFVPYGTTVPGLSDPTFAKDPASYVTSIVVNKDEPKIDATASFWCSNTVRLQVSQYDVTQDGSTCQPQFLDQALGAEVKRAEADGLVVVINDQTESDAAANSEKDPTLATFTFWQCVSQHTESWSSVPYGHDPQVIFDVFNEPRADACTSKNGPYDMNLWRNGGTVNVCGQANVKYQGMDAVVYHLRQDGAQNLLWVEGPGVGNTLAGLDPSGGSSYLITDSLNRVVYSIHHPYAGPGVPANSTTWWNEFGYLVNHPGPAGIAPVVAGEWTNVTAHQQNNPYCWSDAPTSVPAFLGYLAKLGVGLSGYQLAANYLVKADKAWTDTTNYTDQAWNPAFCSYSSGARPPLLGAGADIRAWFQSQD